MAKFSSRSWPVGKRVRFKPNVVSLAMYSNAPAPGTMGKVIAVSLGSKKATYLPGPGGGLVYVDWDKIGVMGVSPIDLEPVKAKQNPVKCEMLADSNPVLTAAERRSLPTSAFADPKNRRFPIHDMEHTRAAVGKLNLWYKRGKITKEQYKEYYQRMMKAYSKFGLTAQTPPLVGGLRVIAGKKKTSGAKPGLKVAVGQNPTVSEPGIQFPLRNSKQAKGAIVILNNFYLKGKISDDEYKHFYEVIASAWKKFGVKGTPTNELESKPAANPARRHLPVLQPYSPEWRERRRQGIASENPAAKVQRNDPSAVRAIMMKVMAQPNPIGNKGDAQMALRISAAEIGMETSRIGKNVSSLDPMEYYDVFLEQGKDPDAAMASLEDMAAWGVTDVI